MVQYDPFSPEIMDGNPYPVYKQLRDEAPAYFLEEHNAWALSRFEDIWNASLDKDNLICSKGTTSAQVLLKVQPVTPMINTMDPPDHTELRVALRGWFMPGAIRKTEAMIQEVVDRHFAASLEKGTFDVMGDFASQVSVTTVCMLCGFPLEDAEMLNDLVWRFFGREEGVDGMTEDGLAAMTEMAVYFMGLAARRRQAPPQDDVVGMFLNVEVGGRKLTDEEIGSHLSMLMIGGSETFPRTFAQFMRRLAEHPDQRAECVADSSLIPNAYHETLRYDMPTQFLCRTVVNPVEFHGKTFEPGQGVCLIYPSGNRDDREFKNPDVFDIHREIPRTLSFGQGIHLCLGMHVARLESRLCMQSVLREIPEYEVDLEGGEWFRTDFVQGFASLPIKTGRG